MIKEKDTHLLLSHQIRGITIIGETHTSCQSLQTKLENEKIQ